MSLLTALRRAVTPKVKPKRPKGVRRLLYISGHEVLEYDDLRLFADAGIDAFSPGAYADPASRGNRVRGPLPKPASQEDFEAYKTGCARDQSNGALWRFTREFAHRFDAVLVNHFPENLLNNLEAIGDMPMILRTVGQSSAGLEASLVPLGKRLRVVRYSEREAHDSLLPTDRVIYFGKYVDEHPQWRPGGKRLVTFMNDAWRHHSRPGFPDYEAIVAGHEADLYGLGNDKLTNARGLVPPARQLALYAECRAYVYLHSLVAPYTLNLLEALCAGAPIIAPATSMTLGSPVTHWLPERYEVEAILSGGAGLSYSSVEEGRAVLARLDEFDLPALSARARSRAREKFDAAKIAEEWRSFFAEI